MVSDRRRAQELAILVIGVTTPLGILAVNASAFVMIHLPQFRFGLGVCALISGLCLNGLGAWVALDRAHSFWPRLYAEYRWWATGVAIAVVLAWSLLGAYGTYWSMRDPRNLPSLGAVLTALWLLALPFFLTWISRRLKLRLGRAEAAREQAVGPPPPAAGLGAEGPPA